MGVIYAFALVGAWAGAYSPYWIASDRSAPGFNTIGMSLGAARHLDAGTMGTDSSGYFHRDGDFGWMGRAHIDIAGKNGDYAAMRVDSAALLRLAGAAGGPILVEALPGVTVWPRVETNADGTRAYAGAGPFLGMRLRTQSASPSIYSELEVDYAPLFGSTPSGYHHHLELAPTLGFTPWAGASGVVAFEVRARFEAALDSPNVQQTAGLSLVGGVRVRLDLLDKIAPPRHSNPSQ